MKKEEIRKRLQQIENLEEKKLLNEILDQVILETMNYQEKIIDTLKKEMKEEIEEEAYPIYTTILPRGEYIARGSWLYPVIPEDLEEQEIDYQLLKNCILCRQKVRIEKIFLACDYLKIEQAVKKERFFKGILTTDKQQLEIIVKLEKNKEYNEKRKDMYEIFLMNQIPWETVNSGYFEKYMDVILVKCNGNIKEKEKIIAIEINYEELENCVEKNLIPIWNWVPTTLKGKSFPIPMKDHINFKYEINIENKGRYLVVLEKENNTYLIRKEEKLEIISNQSAIKEWQAYEITTPRETLYDITYPYMTNQIKESFTNAYQRKYNRSIRTRAEIERKVFSYQVADYIRWERVQIKTGKEQQEIETYSMNPFPGEELHQPQKEKYLCLEFSKRPSWEFLQRDMVSFLVTVLQEYFYEYQVVGCLLEL